ncbi:uncharacterized protein LOC119893589 [Micropterus salmoides]|uniref:uncharacterized protein LOC119893589 n=1 Tax=Micropterus salmoides TaxID=27706 RepID=UPI0018EC2703|nr:uncharacterized protein LOC119893589 [Micropterus salmoides]
MISLWSWLCNWGQYHVETGKGQAQTSFSLELNSRDQKDNNVCVSKINLSPQEIIIILTFIFIILMMPSMSVTQVFLLLAVLHITISLPVRDDDEVESFLTQIRNLNAPWSMSGVNSADTLLKARLGQLLSAGLDRRRQLGDIEFSNRYAEFLRSKAKHSSICAFLRRMESVKKSGVGGDMERVNLLLKQYMCPSVYNNWATDL